MIVKNDALLEVRLDNKVVRSQKKNHVQPSEMISFGLGAAELAAATQDSVLEISIQ